MGIAVLVGVPVGILLTRKPRLREPVIGGANIIETIPSLALFGFLLPAPWLGARADRIAIIALALYALLPIIRNTYVGITGVDPGVREAARGMGLTSRQMLWQVELPLSMSVILAGIRMATVLCIGIATIAAAIGAGGLGEFIFRGVGDGERFADSGGRDPGGDPGAGGGPGAWAGWRRACVRPTRMRAPRHRFSAAGLALHHRFVRLAAQPHRNRLQEFHRTVDPRRNAGAATGSTRPGCTSSAAFTSPAPTSASRRCSPAASTCTSSTPERR